MISGKIFPFGFDISPFGQANYRFALFRTATSHWPNIFVNSRAKNRVSYTLDSTLESVNMAEKTAFDMAVHGGFGEDEQHHIAMAVREAAVNAVLHGNAYDPQKKFFVAYEMTPQAMVITITDQGKGLDETSIPDPLAPENLLKQSGRGIFLIRSFMDEVTIRNLNPGTEIKLVKHVGVKEERK